MDEVQRRKFLSIRQGFFDTNRMRMGERLADIASWEDFDSEEIDTGRTIDGRSDTEFRMLKNLLQASTLVRSSSPAGLASSWIHSSVQLDPRAHLT